MMQVRVATVIGRCPSWPESRKRSSSAPLTGKTAASERPAPAVFPGQHDKDGGHQAQHKGQKRHDPRDPVEAGGGRRGQHRGTVFLYEVLQRQIVVFAAIETRHEFAAHAVGISAADVVALEQDLAAATDAHQLVAQTVEACPFVAGAEEGKHGQAEQYRLQAARRGIGQRLHNFRFSFSRSVVGRQSSARLSWRLTIDDRLALSSNQSPAPTGAG